MVKSAENPQAKLAAKREVKSVQNLEKSRKKPPPGKPYIIKKTWL